jgi:hypothetical protein
MSLECFQHEMGYRTNIRVRSWLEGWARPSIWNLPALAAVLEADPVEVAVGWVFDQCPEIEEVLRKEVLDPRGSTYPRHSDPDIRMPKPLPRVSW